MLGHEILEVLLGVLTAGVLIQQIVKVVEHLVDRLAVLITGVLQRLFHPGETLVEHLPAKKILDLLVLLFRLTAAPLVFREFLHGLGRRGRQRFDLQLLESGVVIECSGQLLALSKYRLVK